MKKIIINRLATLLLLGVSLFLVTTNASAYRPLGDGKLPESAKSLADVYPVYPTIDYGTGVQAKLIKRGEYLAKAGDCIACHTNVKAGGKPFAGGLPIDTPFGTFYSPNITPDDETGIGKWTEKDFLNALHHGKRKDGSNLFPVFPYLYYNRMTEQDIRSIYAYLRAVPKVKQANKENDVPFPFNVRFAQYGWKMLYFYPDDGQLEYDPSQSKAWNRGRYLVDGPGHCSMCHTPINFLGGPKNKYYLTGGFVNDYWAPNITEAGLRSANSEAVVNVFKGDTLINDAGVVAGGMAEVNHNSLQQLTDTDLFAIATYLKSVKDVNPVGLEAGAEKEPKLSIGRKVYFKACSTCHAEGEVGAPVIGHAASWYDRLHTKGINTFYRHAINGYNSMPVKGTCVNCTDYEIEAAVDYILDKSLTRTQKLMVKNGQYKKSKPTMEDGKAIYISHCSVCHAEGKLGAQKLGDKDAWARVLERNMDEIFTSTIKGSAKMPPKGGCKYCSNAEVIAAVKYMVQESTDKGDYSLW